jgi:hypothetical protein
MESALLLTVVILAIASRRLIGGLWSAGRLSDRTTALLLIGRFPVMCCLFGLIMGAPLPAVVVVTLLALLPPAYFYRAQLDQLHQEKRNARQPTQPVEEPELGA